MISKQHIIDSLANSVGVNLDGTIQFTGIWLHTTGEDRVPVTVDAQGVITTGPQDLVGRTLREAARDIFQTVGSVSRVDPFLTPDEVTFVREEAARLGFQKGWDPDMTARQIVDNAWRAGIDIQFKQHLVEAWVTQEGS